MAVGMSAYSGSSCSSNGNYYRVGHNSSTLREDAVWSFNVNDPALATVTSLNVYYSWNNTAAGEGWSGAYTYIIKLYAEDNATLLASTTVVLSGASGSGDIDLSGFSIASNSVCFIHWNQNGSSYSTTKAFHKTAQYINSYAGTSANTPPSWPAGASVSLNRAAVFDSNFTTIDVSWTPANDAEGNQYYNVARVSSLGTVWIRSGVGSTATSITDDIGAGNYGQSYAYHIYVYDTNGAEGGVIFSNTVVKNTPPTWSGSIVTVDGLSAASIIPENDGNLTVAWNPLNTNDAGQTAYYTVYRILPSSVLLASNITDTSIIDNIGTGNQGYQYRYFIYASDGIEWVSANISSAVFTKNTLTPATLASSASLTFHDAVIPFTLAGASNTNGDGAFSYRINSSNVTVYNQANSITSPFSLKIWRTGDVIPASTQPYVKFDDIKAYLALYAYHGTLAFTITTTNAYGSTGVTTKSISTDLREYPSAVTTVSTSGTYLISGSNYYIPDRKAINLTWTVATDPLKTAITYDVQASINGGAFYYVKTGLTTNSTSVSFAQVYALTTCVFKVIAKNSYGYTSSNNAPSINLHYYNPPIIVISALTRDELSAVVAAIITGNSSITAAKTLSTLTWTGKAGTPVTIENTMTPSVTDTILSSDAYTFKYTVQDLGGVAVGTAAQIVSAGIVTYVPMFSVREKGVAVNANVNSDGIHKFEVGGKMKISDQIVSTLATGTAPLVTASTTKVTNLNADMVDGLHASETATGSTIVARNVNGCINATYFNQSSGAESSGASNYWYEIGDGYLRKKSLHNVRREIRMGRGVENAGGADWSLMYGQTWDGYQGFGWSMADGPGGYGFIEILWFGGVGFGPRSLGAQQVTMQRFTDWAGGSIMLRSIHVDDGGTYADAWHTIST